MIGDGEAIPDGEVDGLGEQDLLALYRSMVLLRTYDERSVVYHRQGRIGTYAIFWNHEAMQAGSVYALEREDWIFPSYRESAIGLLRGMPAATILSWWRGHPAGWWNPEEYGVASICVPIATQVPHAVGFGWGSRLKGEDRVAPGSLLGGRDRLPALRRGVLRQRCPPGRLRHELGLHRPRGGLPGRRRRARGRSCRCRFMASAPTCWPSSTRACSGPTS